MLHTLSLTRRLALFFTVACAVLVLGLGLLFMVATQRHFVELDEAALHDKGHLVADILATSGTAGQARRRLAEALNHHQGLHARVENAAVGRLYPPADAADAATAAAGAAGVRAEPEPEPDPAGHSLRLQLRAGFSELPLQVLLVLDSTHHRHFMLALGRSLALYALLAMLVGALLAWLAAHQGLAPLRAIRARAAVVTAQRLDERMPVEAVPVELADLARELNRMLDRLQHDFQRLSDFASDLAHEMRTPLSNLLTQTQVALAHPRDVATYQDILASNAEEFERLGRMVADMLFLAKTERGVVLPRRERFSAAAQARALIEFHEVVAQERALQLSLQGDAYIVGDRLMLRRALSNLLSNALRHAHPGTVVRIEIEATPQGSRLRVCNRGEDIAAQALPRLFDRFYRADPARGHAQAQGTGLGLSITQAIVHAHGGRVAVTSTGGETVFTLEFPNAAEAAAVPRT